MPYDAAHRVFYGDDARRVPTRARRVLMDYLDGALNDEGGPYFAPLGLDATPNEIGEATRKVVVTASARLADAIYSGQAKDPTVFVGKGPKPDWKPSGATIGGSFYEGKRFELSFNLDSGVDTAPSDVVAQEDADSELADFIVDAVERGFDDLALLGLHNVQVEADAEAQRAGTGRNPIRATCFATALDNWAP